MNIYTKALMKIEKIDYYWKCNYCESLPRAEKEKRIAVTRARINKLMEINIMKAEYDKLYNSKLTNDRKWIIDNFEAVLDKYILTLDNVYKLDGNLTLDVEWEEIDPWDKDPSTQTIAEGNIEVNLDRWGLKLLAWAYSREIISGLEFKIMMDSGHVFPNLDQYQEQIIDELLERNDWEFLK